MARTDAGLSRAVSICAGDRVSVVLLDAKGEPVSAGHHCPDCLPGVTLALPPLGLVARQPALSLLPLAPKGHAAAEVATPPQPRAQGPPPSV